MKARCIYIEFQDEEAIYDYVTEDQYADIVNARLQDEWVVGDIKGSGYDDTGTTSRFNQFTIILVTTVYFLLIFANRFNCGG